MRRRLDGRLLVLALMGAALILTACGSATAGDDPSAAVGILDWRDCGDNECATLAVPLDHLDPGGVTVDLAVERARAGTDRIGVLLVNPGGPGASGTALVDVVAAQAPELAARFDIVGWDPRGVGESVPLQCEDPLQQLYLLDATPDDGSEQAELDRAAQAASDECAADAGPLLDHIGTTVVADDLEAIRAALGEDQISYLGFSYGTAIGLTYMDRYPDRVRAIVLDGVFEPTGDLEYWLTSQAVALEAALDRMLGDRARDYDQAAAAAEAGRISATPQDVAHAALAATYVPSRQPGFLDAVTAAAAGDGSAVSALGATYVASAAFDAYTAVVCADRVAPDGADAFAAMADRVASVAPRVGGTVANELLPCATWAGATAAPAAAVVVDVETLVIGNTGDAATPYEAAVRISGALPRATLLTYESEGHLSFLQGSGCIDQAVVAYLLTTELPPAGSTCAG